MGTYKPGGNAAAGKNKDPSYMFPSRKLLHISQIQEWETGRSTGQRSSYEEQMMGANAVSK